MALTDRHPDLGKLCDVIRAVHAMADVVDAKVPKPIQAVREKLRKLGLEITVENLKAHLSPKEMNAAQNCLRSNLRNTDSSKAERYAEMNRKE